MRERVSLGTISPFNSGKLEDQLRLLKADPLIQKIQATLKPGSRERSSILEVKVTPAPPLFGNIGVNNNSPQCRRCRDEFRTGLPQPLGLGDTFSISYQPRIEDWTGTYSVDVNYSVPINPMDGRINARVSIQENKIVEGPFRPLDIRGETQYYEINWRQPVIRTPREELALSVGLSYRHGQTFTFFGPTPLASGLIRMVLARLVSSPLARTMYYGRKQAPGVYAPKSVWEQGYSVLQKPSYRMPRMVSS